MVKRKKRRLLKNIAGRIPETTRREKTIMTKQLEQLLLNLNLHKCHKKLRKNRKAIQKQIEQKTN